MTEILYPKRCAGCDQVLDSKEKNLGFCRECSSQIRLTGQYTCFCCGKPLKDKTDEFCTDCMGKSHSFNQNKTVFCYSGPMKISMYRFKYGNRRCYGRTFAAMAQREYGRWIRDKKIEAIIPVPMYKKKVRQRGYNQAEAFAKCLSKVTGIPQDTNLVARIHDTRPMKELDGMQRKANLQKAFTLNESGKIYNRVLVVDDIYTTGATMDQVAALLKSAGVKEVYGLCVCTGDNTL